MPLLCNALWDQAQGEDSAASVDAVAMQAAHHLKGILWPVSAESFLRKLGSEKGVDFYALGKAPNRSL